MYIVFIVYLLNPVKFNKCFKSENIVQCFVKFNQAVFRSPGYSNQKFRIFCIAQSSFYFELPGAQDRRRLLLLIQYS